MSADGKAAAATTAGASAGSGAGGSVAASGGSVGIDVAPAAAGGGAGAAQSKQPESAAALIVAGGGSLTGPKTKPQSADGKDAAEAKITVSADGKTKTVVFSHPPDAQHKLDSRAWPLMAEGDKKLNACCGRDPPGARDCYDKAAGQFKLDEEWEEAAAAYIKAAEVAETITDLDGLEAGRFYEQAAKCMRTSSSRNALQILEYAKKVYEDKVSTQSMAKVWETMGEIYEKDLKEYAKAMDAYERAADNLMAQDTFAKANAVLLKVATIAASRYDFKRAIGIYERIAKKCLEPSGKYISEGVQVVRHLYHAMICQLVMAARAGDIAPANVALARYRAMGQFERSDEFKFCADLVRAFETNDAQLFTDTCYKYDKTHPLDQWSSTLLLECKQILKGVKSGNLDSIHLDLQSGAGGAGAGGSAADPDLQ